MFPVLVLLAVGPGNGSWFGSGGWVKQGEVEAHAPVGSVTRGIRVIFPANLKADRLFSDLKDLAHLEDERHSPFRVAWRVVPVGGGFRTESESRMRLGRLSEKRLEKHLADALSILLDGDGPELVHERAGG